MKYILFLLSMSILLSCASNSVIKEEISLNDDVVILYSASWCYWCEKSKEFLKDNKIHYIEKDLENPKDFKELENYAKSINYKGNINAVPLFIVKGKILIGFQPIEIIYLLEKKSGIIRTYTKKEKEEQFKGSEVFTNKD